jgi:16S rRNA (adenine1518-N6/adenine1519-N6)-dimethyltransferase
LLAGASKPRLMVLTVQKEVAERITAVPNHMSLLAISVQFYGRPAIVDELKAGAFWPRPDVDSALVRIDLTEKTAVPLAEERAFFHVVRIGFSQKRKQLKNNLRGLGLSAGEIETALAQAGVDGRRRAETLSLAEWVALYRATSEQ